MCEQEALEGLGLFHGGVDDVHDLIDHALTFNVVTTSPVIGCSRDLADDAAFIEELGHLTGFNAVDDAWLEVHKHCTGDELTVADLVEEDFHVAVGGDGGAVLGHAVFVEAVLAEDEPPVAVCDLIATLSDVNADDFSHGMEMMM